MEFDYWFIFKPIIGLFFKPMIGLFLNQLLVYFSALQQQAKSLAREPATTSKPSQKGS